MEDYLWGIIVAVALIIGLGAGFLIALFLPAIKAKRAALRADKIINDAEIKAEHITKNAQLDAKQTIFDMKKEAEADIKERKQEVVLQENKLLQREQTIDARDAQLTKREQAIEDKDKNLDSIRDDLKKKEETVNQKIDELLAELEKVAHMTEKEAKDQIFAKVQEKEAMDIAKYMKEREEEAESEADEKAKNILGTAISRHAQEIATDRTVSVISIPNDEMKGRIIGREGRNIKTLENLLGVDILIDDTPDAITVSCFNPIRREIASQALAILVKDGRIQPSRIEEVVDKCQKNVDETIRKAGEEAVFKLGLANVNKDLIKYIGRLKFRTSYGQNQLEHSVEVAELCGVMAAELGLDQNLAKRAGLLHDIGKSADFEVEGSHVEIGARLARKYGESPIVINAIAAHHGDVPTESVIANLVIAADTLSAARPGARSETLETYIKRIEQLETICKSYDGVQNCYAMQSGREVRVMVIPDKIDDTGAFKLAHDIKERIENEMKYPGQIKVNVIREYRTQEIAK
jgi:ribonuclease Y